MILIQLSARFAQKSQKSYISKVLEFQTSDNKKKSYKTTLILNLIFNKTALLVPQENKGCRSK